MTREIIAKYGVDSRRVYVAGLSAGGAMAAIVKSTHPDLFAAAGVRTTAACRTGPRATSHRRWLR